MIFRINPHKFFIGAVKVDIIIQINRSFLKEKYEFRLVPSVNYINFITITKQMQYYLFKLGGLISEC